VPVGPRGSAIGLRRLGREPLNELDCQLDGGGLERVAHPRPQDREALDHHGGRSLDYAPSTLEVLAEIVDAVRGRVPVLFDSGIRRGSDILKALALGASAVCVGRVPLFGLSAYGAAGVQRVLEILQAELVQAMLDVGRPTLASLDRSLLRTDFR